MRLFFFTFLMFLFFSVQAQSKFGVRGGVSFSKFRYYSNDDYFLTSDPVSNYEVGFISFFKLGKKIFIAPEVNYLQKGGAIPNRPDHRIETLYKQIEFAFPVGYEFTYRRFSFSAKTGLQYGYMLSGVAKLSGIPDQKIKFKDNMDLNRSDFGILAGGGVSISILSKTKLSIEYRYRRSLNYTRDAELEDFKLSTKNIVQGIYLGCIFELK